MRLKYVKISDILACIIFLVMLPFALLAKIFIHDFWLIGEGPQDALDNGYWLFKWIREYRPKQKVAYVIDKKSADYRKVKDIGKIIQWGSISHWFWYLVAKKNISNNKGCKPNAAACYLFEVKLRLWRNKRYFLQHGITKDDADWLYYKNCRFHLFVCGAKPEFDFIKEHFGYPDGVVQYLGFARFDNLHKEHDEKKQILVIPTWREYLVRPHGNVTKKTLKEKFIESNYFKFWSEFLCASELQNMLDEYNYELLFYPHRNMQIYLDFFRTLKFGRNIKIAEPDTMTVQDAMMQSACMVTDYSSVFFDFAYMKKPIIFYQFDEAEFRANQYAQGYFDYHNNSLGAWSGSLENCLFLIKEQLLNGCAPNDRVKEFFEIYDNKNCERNYLAIKNN